jgi:bifunctional lysine-specific demethylase and histidyl-hydroxylase NO66
LLSKARELPTGFGDLFSQEAADELLSRRGLRTPFIRVAKDGKVISASRYTGAGGVGAMVGDQVADDRILELFLDGHTVVLQGLHRLWPPIIDFAGALTIDLGHPVQVNAYITPPSSTGFSAHYDVHDVFVLQIAGEKRWRIHEPVLVHPLRTQPWEDRAAAVSARASEQPLVDEVLRPGDALYLPRGFLHAAEALGEMSIHLTVGVHPVTRHTVLEALTALVADEPLLRSSLPLGVDVSDPAQIETDVAATAEALIDRLRTVTAAQVADRLAAAVVPGNRAGPISPLHQADQASRLNADTVLEIRPHLRHALRYDEHHVVVTLPDRRLELPLATGKAVKALLDGARLRVAELPGVDGEDALVLARRLVREAVVVVVERQ